MHWLRFFSRRYELPIVALLLVGFTVCEAEAQDYADGYDDDSERYDWDEERERIEREAIRLERERRSDERRERERLERERRERSDRSERERESDPEPLDDRSISAWDHFELSMGFIAGQRRYGELTWDGGQRYEPMLDRTPFDKVTVLGLRYDLRLVVSYVRMTAGVDLPFTSYDASDTRMMLGDAETTVSSLRGWNLHFGIGAEYPFGPVAPFIDVLGDVAFAEATFSTDAGEEKLDGRGFGFALRGGLRLHVRKWFFASLSAEVGLVGDVRWGTELSVGFALM